jgi:hypothetical protein
MPRRRSLWRPASLFPRSAVPTKKRAGPFRERPAAGARRPYFAVPELPLLLGELLDPLLLGELLLDPLLLGLLLLEPLPLEPLELVPVALGEDLSLLELEEPELCAMDTLASANSAAAVAVVISFNFMW